MDRALQVFAFVVLAIVGVSAALSIRMHINVWRFSPPMERLRRPAPDQQDR